MSYGAYLIGRTLSPLQAPFEGHDQLYASTRLDGMQITNGNYAHCTFANISFKEVGLSASHFSDCVFIGCYFRQTNIRNTQFSGCRFFDCDFPRVAIRSCDFPYCKFQNCFIEYSEMEHNLPQQPNIREELARVLGGVAADLGFPKDARKYRMCQIRSREENLKAAVKGSSQWYRDHYDFLRRVGAFFKLLNSYANRYLWGYGQRIWVLVLNFFLMTTVMFPVIFYVVRDHLKSDNIATFTFLDTMWFSLENILPIDLGINVYPVSTVTRLFAGLESVLSIVFVGLLVSYLFRSIRK